MATTQKLFRITIEGAMYYDHQDELADGSRITRCHVAACPAEQVYALLDYLDQLGMGALPGVLLTKATILHNRDFDPGDQVTDDLLGNVRSGQYPPT